MPKPRRRQGRSIEEDEEDEEEHAPHDERAHHAESGRRCEQPRLSEGHGALSVQERDQVGRRRDEEGSGGLRQHPQRQHHPRPRGRRCRRVRARHRLILRRVHSGIPPWYTRGAT